MLDQIRILFDHQIFEMQNTGGISRYFSELFIEWSNYNSIQYILSTQYSDNKYLNEQILKRNIFGTPMRLHDDNLNYLAPLLKINPEVYRKIYDYVYYRNEDKKKNLNKLATIEQMKTHDYDIFHPTYFDDYFFPFLDKKPYVITVHDLIEELYPEFFIKTNLNLVKKGNLIKRASHVIAVSENTKKDIIKIFGIPSEKITTIYHGHRHKKLITIDIPNFPKLFFLYIGQRHHYKNFYFTVEALGPLLESYPDIKIICLGGQNLTREERTFFLHLNLENRIFWIDASDEVLAYCYHHAIALLYTSLYEGFGIPVIEAFYEGCPVIGSNTSSIPEIGKDAIAYISPKNPQTILNAAKRILTEPDYRNHLIMRGKELAPLYSWNHTAKQTLEVYKKVLQ